MCYADIPIIINVRSFTGQANKKGYKCGSGSLNTYRIQGIPCLRCCFYRAGYHQKNGIFSTMSWKGTGKDTKISIFDTLFENRRSVFIQYACRPGNETDLWYGV